jgi:hypothetical protein
MNKALRLPSPLRHYEDRPLAARRLRRGGTRRSKNNKTLFAHQCANRVL